MTNTKLLKEIIEKSNHTTRIEEKRLEEILSGAECNAREIIAITEDLHLTSAQRDEIFFS